jgi:hypothetical protein
MVVAPAGVSACLASVPCRECLEFPTFSMDMDDNEWQAHRIAHTSAHSIVNAINAQTRYVYYVSIITCIHSRLGRHHAHAHTLPMPLIKEIVHGWL